MEHKTEPCAGGRTAPRTRIGHPIAVARVNAGLLQQDAADRLGVGRNVWRRWETGASPIPSARLFDVAAMLPAIPLSVLTNGKAARGER